jgi:beta-lactamase superfamily II metal-dependent hydrolase
MKRHLLPLLIFLLCVSSFSFAQENGNLQIHFMSVGQGDGAVLISPRGEIVLFDDGVRTLCDKPIAYLQQLGIERIDYHITSHYHDDHIGCAREVLTEFPLLKQAIDRGFSYPSTNRKGGTFWKYKQVVGTKRVKATKGMTITLDAGTENPVRIKMVALNGNGTKTTNENDLSLVAVVSYGRFDAVMGGDLSGVKSGMYEDIETSVAPLVGQVEVYKVNHHGSRYSTNVDWINTIKPRIGIISVGSNKDHGHPTKECLKRLHDARVKTYWTHSGTGANPKAGWDKIGGNIVVEVEPNSSRFTVSYNGGDDEDRYDMWPLPNNALVATPTTLTVTPSATSSPEVQPKYVWSKKAKVYHYADCIYVHNIHPENYQSGNTKPEGKNLHKDCPK